MENKIPSFLTAASGSHSPVRGGGKVESSYLDKGIRDFAALFSEGHLQWEMSSGNSFLHDLDARIKIIFWLSMIIVISLKKTILPEAGIFLAVFCMAALCRLDLISFYRKVLALGSFFGFLVSLPSALNIFVPGKVILPIITLTKSHDVWIYHVPQVIGITSNGLRLVSLLTLRVLDSLSISFLILYTTPFAEIIKAMKVIKVPDTFILIISMAYKYIFTFARIVADMHLAKKARLGGVVARKDAQEWIAGRIAFVFKKTQIECEEVFKAMNARGFSGEVRVYHYRKITGTDWIKGLCLLMMTVGFVII